MALKNFNKLTDFTTYERFLNKPELTSARKITNANKLDMLIDTPGFQGLFKVNRSVKGRSKELSGERSASGKSKGSFSFICQNRDSPVPKSLTPCYSNGNCKDKLLNEEQRLVEISKELHQISKDTEKEWLKLDNRVTSSKRKSTFENVKKLKSVYSEMKEARLTTIKRYRILKSAYPEGIQSKIYNWNDSVLSNDQRKQSNFYIALSKIFKSDLSTKSSEPPNIQRSSSRKNSHNPLNSFPTFSHQPTNSSRKKQFPNNNRSHNIITGVIF